MENAIMFTKPRYAVTTFQNLRYGVGPNIADRVFNEMKTQYPDATVRTTKCRGGHETTLRRDMPLTDFPDIMGFEIVFCATPF